MKGKELVPVVSIVNNQPTTTSKNIAEYFGKEHKNVLRDIQGLGVPKDFRRLNFERTYYENGQSKRHPMYIITRDGFTILAMGFTGKKAMQFKIAYIEAFNGMEAQLKRQYEKRIEAKYQPLQIENLTLSEDQKAEIRRLVNKKVGQLCPKKSWYPAYYGDVYRAIKAEFKVKTYKDVPSSLYYDLRAFISSMSDEEDQPANVYTAVSEVMADMEGVLKRARKTIAQLN